MKIFVSICSYNDDYLINTLKEAYDKALNKDLLFFGLALSYDTYPDLSFIPKNQMHILKFKPEQRPGVNKKRYLIASMFEDQDYYLQIDSHMTFVNNWDVKLVECLNNLKNITNNEKVLLSYVQDHNTIKEINDEVHYIDEESIYKPSYSVKTGDSHILLVPVFSEKFPNTLKEFEKINMIKSNFIFADKNFISEVGFDPYTEIYHEEPFHSWMAHVKGWDVYMSPHYQYVTHLFLPENYKKIFKSRMYNRPWGSEYSHHVDNNAGIVQEHLKLMLYNKSTVYNFTNNIRDSFSWFKSLGLERIYAELYYRYNDLFNK